MTFIMVNFVGKVLSFILGNIYYVLCKIHLCKPSIIISMDGGICSQMHQYLLGYYLHSRGYKIEYSLDFYKKNGLDTEKKQVRNFDLLKAFPYLLFNKSNIFKEFLYRHFVYTGRYPKQKNLDWMNVVAPKWLQGYFSDPPWLYTTLYNSVFIINPDFLDDTNRIIYNSIGDRSVAIHVRRGDLSGYNEAYGNPVSIQYFVDAISYILEHIENPSFYFFSDDYNYVKNELIPQIKFNINYEIVTNLSNKGYVDLFLISKCSHVIASKGSLGKFGSLFNMNPSKIVIVSKDDVQTFMFENISGILVAI